MLESTFDALIGDFYRAATGAIDWDEALLGVQTAFRARCVVLHTVDIAAGGPPSMLSVRASGPDIDNALLTYIREYHAIDPRRAHQLSLGPSALGQWQHDNDVFTDAFVAKDRFYQDYLPAFDTRYNAAVTIPIEGSVITGFAFELPASRGPFDPDEREVARRLGDHLRDALRAFERVRTLMSQALAGHGLLSAFPYPMWLLDEDRHALYENQSAAVARESADRVALRGARFVLIRSASDRQLTVSLHTLCRSPHGTSTVIDLRTTAAEPPTWLHLSVLVPEDVMGAFGARPQVLATLFDPHHVSPLDPYALTQMFGLTPTEAKVAARLADGLNAEQIGRTLGTAEATVRTQVRQVIHKLGAQRTVDVVRILRQGEALWSMAGRSAA